VKKAESDGKLYGNRRAAVQCECIVFKHKSVYFMLGVYIVQDRWNRPVLLFRNPWKVGQLAGDVEYLNMVTIHSSMIARYLAI